MICTLTKENYYLIEFYKIDSVICFCRTIKLRSEGSGKRVDQQA